ncbi:MAG: hypothetical protein V2I76_09890 [Roseobacter sp.]|jgi:hypothetical protein|nr:hypothetical protein [Roseobacter sp.]
MREPLARLKEGDFSFHDQFKTEPDEYLLQFMNSTDTGEFFDLCPVLSSDFRFSSAAEPGLEAADIIANATRRALGGNLKEFGWTEIPNLMIQRSGHCIRLMTVAADEIVHPKLPYASVIDGYRRGGRSMFPAE